MWNDENHNYVYLFFRNVNKYMENSMGFSAEFKVT